MIKNKIVDMKFVLKKPNRNTPEEELISDLKRVAKELKTSILIAEQYQKYGKFHPTTFRNRFGSWTKALELAGLDTTIAKLRNTKKGNVISEFEAFDNIKNMWIELGRQPKYNEVRKPFSKYSAGFYDKRFGSWIKSLERFVNYINEDNSELSNSQQDSNLVQPSSEMEAEEKIIHKTKRHISDRQRFRILMRDGFACCSCGSSPQNERGIKLHIDHIIPWSKGGETVDENLETKCQKCNLGKGNAFNK